MTPGSQLPQLLPTSQKDPENSATTVAQIDDDNETSMYEVPALPSSGPRVRFLVDSSEGEETVEKASKPDCPLLYASIPNVSESGTEARGEKVSGTTKLPQRKLIATSSKQTDDQLPEMSGRSRANPKTYFEETKAFKLPPGHPTVAFTVYHREDGQRCCHWPAHNCPVSN